MIIFAECFFELSFVSEFIIDILTRPADSLVRNCAVEQFYQLSTISTAMLKSPRQRLIQVLVRFLLEIFYFMDLSITYCSIWQV